ncbi:amino acid ABC transporter membrane protein 2, PAAT family [Desulfocapsa sulfexigens DSM 10523]|uniref:Amino acid ABC transporter membrane protein 2, PAAT family n=1 Tax=Desulfocapsa sulfexigens (strain DSM 10523 / SB164P1) TaxID=1167006 RepID=M1PCS4_DESSD|nr:amino acid ABC transporter permease [Desulfocapsa sulfexigens]AGF77535.1 amino acid ABC transporter membrane protein 2, PAAT family [Desulfocapsa sulfexigens DSM 10523]
MTGVYLIRKSSTVLDIAVTSVILLFIGYITYRLSVGLNYRWDWGVIPNYLFRWDGENERWVSNILIDGFLTTIRLSLWAIFFATIIGVLMGILRTRKRLLYRMIGRSYVELIRNIPPLVLVFIFYFFVSDQLMLSLGVDEFVRSRTGLTAQWLSVTVASPELFTAFVSGVFTVALFQGAYIAEIVRAGIQSIDNEQWEASAALGLRWLQQMRFIVLPQATRRVLPPLANEFINTIKYSSIVSIISIQELTFQGMQVMTSTQRTNEVWLTISFMYFVLCFAVSLIARRLEISLAEASL